MTNDRGEHQFPLPLFEPFICNPLRGNCSNTPLRQRTGLMESAGAYGNGVAIHAS